MKTKFLIPVLSCLSLAAPLHAAPLLVSHWDTSVDATYSDGSPTGTAAGGASIVTSHGVPQLTDSTGYLSLPNLGGLHYAALNNMTDGANPLTSGSIQFWFAPNIDNWTDGTTTNIFYTDGGGSGVNRIQFVKAGGSDRVTLQYFADSTLTAGFLANSSGVLKTGKDEWNYVGLSWSPTQVNVVLNGASRTAAVSNSQTVAFGTLRFGTVFGNLANINLDNLRTSNTALSVAELQAGYTATLQFVPEPTSTALFLLGGFSVFVFCRRRLSAPRLS